MLPGRSTGHPFLAAASASPVYTNTFGTLSGATFNGNGIPNDAVAISTNSESQIVLGLTATSRYMPNAVTNNGVSTFYAKTGNTNTASDPYATWNFDFDDRAEMTRRLPRLAARCLV